MSPENVRPIRAQQIVLRAPSHARWSRALSALSLITLLAGSFVACDLEDDGFGRARVGRGDAFRDRGRDRDAWRHGRHRRGAEAPDAAADAGANPPTTDAGGAALATNAGDAGGAAQPVGADLLDAGPNDAAAPSAVAALSDGQILLVADELLAGGIAGAQAALPRLAEPDAAAFAQRLIDEHAAARNTLEPVGVAIGVTPSASAIADDVSAGNDAQVAALTTPDAGGIDAFYLETTIAAHGDALALVRELITASDATALRAQLVVVQAVLEVQLARAQELASEL